jgi:U4/U6 small nuclear ribonucleoprotein PRP3
VAFDGDLCATYSELAIGHSKTVAYVEHPVPIQPAIDINAPRAMPLMLTKKERKRIRRQRRAEREKEKQDKVRLGLLPAPAPKVKISNLMRVLGERAVADPSMVEKEVREQMEARQRNHDMRNLARKLTPEERKEKARKKNLKGMEDGVHVALFRVKNLDDKQHRFKVDVNAQESQLTGCVVLCKSAGTNLVVVEGGTWLLAGCVCFALFYACVFA